VVPQERRRGTRGDCHQVRETTSITLTRAGNRGALNHLLRAAALAGHGWLTDHRTAPPAIIVMPMVHSVLAVVAIHTCLINWNSFLFPLILTNTTSMRTLPVGVALLSQGAHAIDWGTSDGRRGDLGCAGRGRVRSVSAAHHRWVDLGDVQVKTPETESARYER
jgi:hypothetical protein